MFVDEINCGETMMSQGGGLPIDDTSSQMVDNYELPISYPSSLHKQSSMNEANTSDPSEFAIPTSPPCVRRVSAPHSSATSLSEPERLKLMYLEQQQEASRRFNSRYILNKDLGSGTYAQVKLGYDQVQNRKVAVKIIKKSQIKSQKHKIRINREIKNLKSLNHPNVIKIYDVFETETDIIMIMEYISGGELFDFIVNNKVISEKMARMYFRQIISAVDYCHGKRIVHRDLKPENLLLSADNSIIKIIDFGFSNHFSYSEQLDTFCGSPFYASPEMVTGQKYIGPEVDIWSMGVILYALLCGCLPFDDNLSRSSRVSPTSTNTETTGSTTTSVSIASSSTANTKESSGTNNQGNITEENSTSSSTRHNHVRILYSKIASGLYKDPVFLSDEARDVIRKCLTVDPRNRITAPELRLHSWVNYHYPEPPLRIPLSKLAAIVDRTAYFPEDVDINKGYVKPREYINGRFIFSYESRKTADYELNFEINKIITHPNNIPINVCQSDAFIKPISDQDKINLAQCQDIATTSGLENKSRKFSDLTIDMCLKDRKKSFLNTNFTQYLFEDISKGTTSNNAQQSALHEEQTTPTRLKAKKQKKYSFQDAFKMFKINK